MRTYYRIIYLKLKEWMILSRNLVKQPHSLRYFELLYLFSAKEGFTVFHSLIVIWIFFFQVFYPMLLPGYLRLLRLTFPLLMFLADRKKEPLGTDYPSVHLRYGLTRFNGSGEFWGILSDFSPLRPGLHPFSPPL